MARLPELDEERLTTEQKEIYDRIKSVRGQVRGPFAIWLRNAELADTRSNFRTLFASRVTLDRRLVQLMILVSARLSSAQFAWFVHEPHAREHGISSEIIEAIRQRRTPVFAARMSSSFTTSQSNSTPLRRKRVDVSSRSRSIR